MQVGTEKEEGKIFINSREGSKELFVGSKPPKKGGWEKWFTTVDASPYPIKYTIRKISELLKTVYFSDADKSTMNTKRAM